MKVLIGLGIIISACNAAQLDAKAPLPVKIEVPKPLTSGKKENHPVAAKPAAKTSASPVSKDTKNDQKPA